jgi:polar amino acid transport system substrate-binding protein
MKVRCVSLVWCCVALFVCLPAMAAEEGSAPPDRIRLVSDEWPGYTNRDGSGLGWDIMRLLFEPAGLRVEHRTEVYTRSVGLVQRGEADAWLGAYRNEGFENVFYPRRSYALDPVTALGLGSKPAPTLADLARYRLFWMRGYGYEHHLPGVVDYQEIERRSGVLEMLDRDRGDFYIDARPETERVRARSDKPDRYRITELTGLPMYPGFADTPRGRALAAVYDRRMAEVSRDGSLRRLYAHWHQAYLFDKYPDQAAENMDAPD